MNRIVLVVLGGLFLALAACQERVEIVNTRPNVPPYEEQLPPSYKRPQPCYTAYESHVAQNMLRDAKLRRQMDQNQNDLINVRNSICDQKVQYGIVSETEFFYKLAAKPKFARLYRFIEGEAKGVANVTFDGLVAALVDRQFDS